MVKRPILSEDDVRAFEQAFVDKAPPALSEADLVDVRQVESFRIQPLTVGATLRLAMNDGETVDCLFSAVTARLLIMRLTTAAIEAGWMSEDGYLLEVFDDLDS